MQLDGPPLWDFFEVMAFLRTLRPNAFHTDAKALADDDAGRARVYAMHQLLPAVEAYVSRTYELLTRPDAEVQRHWVEVRDRLSAGALRCDWPDPRHLRTGRAMRTAIEYVSDMHPAALRTACDEGPTPERDWRDVCAELLSTGVHLRKVQERENMPTVGVAEAAERRAATRRAEERRRELARWKSS